jgi:hypothetical protein
MSEENKSPIPTALDKANKAILSGGRQVATYTLTPELRIEAVLLRPDDLLAVAPDHYDAFLLYAASQWLRYVSNNNAKDGSPEKLAKSLASLGGYLNPPSKAGIEKTIKQTLAAILAAKEAGDKELAKSLSIEYKKLLLAQINALDIDDE